MIIQISTVILSAVLFAWGGYNFNKARRFILPSVLCGVCLWLTRDIWCLTQLATIGIFCLGYGEDAPLTHIFGPSWGRGIWGLLGGITLSLGLFLTGHLAWYWFAAYFTAGFILENALKNVWQVAGDLIIGAAFGSIVFLIH